MIPFGKFFTQLWTGFDRYYEAHKNELPPLEMVRSVSNDTQ